MTNLIFWIMIWVSISLFVLAHSADKSKKEIEKIKEELKQIKKVLNIKKGNKND